MAVFAFFIDDKELNEQIDFERRSNQLAAQKEDRQHLIDNGMIGANEQDDDFYLE